MPRITITSKNCLATTHPALAKQWHPTENDLTPKEVGAWAIIKAWWICSKNEDHVWDATPMHRAKRNQGCPYCAGLRINHTNCLATTHPLVAAEWHPTKNGELNPNNVVAGSTKKVWWLCPNGHERPATILDRTFIKPGKKEGSQCPFC